jgi:hypothetical protein
MPGFLAVKKLKHPPSVFSAVLADSCFAGIAAGIWTVLSVLGIRCLEIIYKIRTDLSMTGKEIALT